MRAYFLGVRGSTPAPGESFVRYGGFTSCVALCHARDVAPRLILDSGTGIRRASAMCGGDAFEGTILLTHLHWDHVHGLPFFGAADRDSSQVSLFLPEQADGADAVDVLARAMSPPHFPIGPEDLRGKWNFSSLAPGTIEFDGFLVEAREVPHKGGRTYGYRVSDGKSVLSYIPDHCPTEMGPGPDGWGEYHPAVMDLARDVDLLIHDVDMALHLFGKPTAVAASGWLDADRAVDACGTKTTKSCSIMVTWSGKRTPVRQTNGEDAKDGDG